MSHRVLAYVVIAIAVVLSLAVTFIKGSPMMVGHLIDFIKEMLPLLAVGALLKYLLCNKLP
jgi:hypothetical protein